MAVMEAEGRTEVHKKCSRCRQRPRAEEIEHCLSCLGHVVEKRAKKALGLAEARTAGTESKSGRKLAIACRDKNSLGCVAAAYVAKKLLLPGVTVEVVSKQEIKGKAFKNLLKDAAVAIIMVQCADETAANFFWAFIRKNCKLTKYEPVSIFESVTEKELELYAKIKSLKYAKAQNNSLKQRLRLRHRLQGLQAKYPGTIEAIVQTSRKLKGLLSKRV